MALYTLAFLHDLVGQDNHGTHWLPAVVVQLTCRIMCMVYKLLSTRIEVKMHSGYHIKDYENKLFEFLFSFLFSLSFVECVYGRQANIKMELNSEVL